MPRKKQSELIAEQQEVIRSELAMIGEADDPSDEDVTRAEELAEELEAKEVERKRALERESKLDEIIRSARNPGQREGPEIIRKVDPFDTHEELKRSLWTRGPFDPADTVSRAHMAVDRGPRHMDDRAKERVSDLLDLDNQHAPLIARHILLTGSPRYHEQFKEYVASRGTYVGELLRTAMSLTDANGGYLVPFTLDQVKVA